MSSPTTRFHASLLTELIPKRKFGYALPYLMQCVLTVCGSVLRVPVTVRLPSGAE